MPFFTIIQKETLAPATFSLTVRCDDAAFSAQPGQFLHILCGHSRILRRPISIADVQGDAVTMVFEAKGEGTQWLSRCGAGDRLDILGPLGRGFTLPEGKILVVGGGIGVPPLLYTVRSAPGPVTAILGFRDRSRVILADAFEAVCDAVVITTDDGSAGLHGPVTKPLEEALAGGGYEAVLACGPRAMLKAVAAASAARGVPCQVSMEERMGCGIGACLVCACKTQAGGEAAMSRVCKDGPVFDAGEVCW